MQADAKLYCQQCQTLTAHTSESKFDHLGALVSRAERCRVCRTENGTHELPSTVHAPNELTTQQMLYCRYFEHLIRTGALTEWPRDWWVLQTPGVWG